MNLIKVQIILKSFHWNADIREKVAEELYSYETKWAERILRRMTYDWNWIVRINAVESLQMGQELKTLRRLKKLTKCKDELIRAYAYVALVDVVMNRKHSYEIEKMLLWLKKKYQRENSDLVKFFIVPQLYEYGYKECFQEFKKLVDNNLKIEHILKHNYTWRMIYALKDMTNESNQEEITRELLKIKPYLNNVQKAFIETEWKKDL